MNELDYFFKPKTVAVIGASRNPGKIGYVIMQNFVLGKFKGEVIPINPNADNILRIKAHPNILDVKKQIDMAVIALPSPLVPKALEECAQKKVKGVIIVSGGFEEIGRTDLRKKLDDIKRKNPKMRIIGPNCLGVFDAYTGSDTLFLPEYRLARPMPGKISFISQSGALGSAIIDWVAAKGYGMNKFISYGNALDVDETDLVEYLAQDKNTSVIAIYIEGTKRGRKFFEICRKVSKKKPIIIIKGGKTEMSGKAVQSHTGSLAGDIAVYKAVIKQAGLIEAQSMKEVFDFARCLIREPEPKGDRIQIITNGGGYGVLAADAVVENNLKLAKLNNKTVNALKKEFPPHVVISNPMDLTGDADNLRFKRAIEAALNDKNVDAVLVNLLFQVPTLDSEIVEIMASLNARKTKPLLVMSVGGNFSELHRSLLEKENINTFTSPFNAIKALSGMIEYHKYKKKNNY